MNKGKVYFIGAGPGDPDLITVKGRDIVSTADVIIYAGSLVNPKILKWKKNNACIYDSAEMTLEKIADTIKTAVALGKIVARLHTGDISLFSAINEQIRALKGDKIPFEVIPGVSSASASAARLKTELTHPEISQTVIYTRIAGRTPVPESQSISSLAKHRATLCIFLSVNMIDRIIDEVKFSYSSDTPAAVVYKATWEEEKVISGDISDIAQKTKDAGIENHAIIIIGDAIREHSFNSRLYSKDFSHQFRERSDE